MTACPKPLKSPPKIRKAPKRSNPKRKASEFARCYHSKERVAYIRGLPCCACGLVGYSENAHLPSRSGMSRKGDYTQIIALCGPHPPPRSRGCHRELHDGGRHVFEWVWQINLTRCAASTEQSWLASLPKEQQK